MIKPSEIQVKSRKEGVRDQQIEKDYLLSWILHGISKHDQLSRALVFKGGTVLKKIYFDDYRFSEDLDFTLLKNEITNTQLFNWFKATFEYVLEEANIRLEIIDNDNLHIEQDDGGINFYISYIGPLGGQGNNKKVKVDISKNEKLEFPPVMKNVLLPYSDLKEHQILCYSLEEILIEKMRTVMQRMQARDFYDIWYLLHIQGMDANYYSKEFSNKCENKNINANDFKKKLTDRLPQYKGRWESSMNEQIQNLPNFEKVERETLRYLKKLNF